MKKLYILILMLTFIFNTLNAEVKKDCDGKKLINKIWCKSKKMKLKDEDGKSNFSLKPDLNKFSDSKTLADLFKKKD